MSYLHKPTVYNNIYDQSDPYDVILLHSIMYRVFVKSVKRKMFNIFFNVLIQLNK